MQSKSVWPFVSEFAKAMGLQAFHQSFSDKASFSHWVSRYNREGVQSPKLLYVAAHGSDGRIAGLQKSINGNTVVSTLKKAKKIKYVHFGSCFFGSENNLGSLLREVNHLQWAAGYEKAVGWVDSTLFDIMLWGRIAVRDTATKGLKTHTIAQSLVQEIPGLAKNLGFRFQYRYGQKINCLFSGADGYC